MEKDMNGWGEYSRHVLKELERLNLNQERVTEKLQEFRDGLDGRLDTALASIRSDLNSLQNKIAHFEPNKVVQLEVEVGALKKSSEHNDDRIRSLELSSSSFGGKWTIISAVGAVLLSAVISMLFSMAKAEPSPEVSPEKTPAADLSP